MLGEVRSGRPSRFALIAALGSVTSVVGYFATQVSMLWWRSDWSVSGFRSYYASDQLSYLSMVVNGANGDFSAREPFTQTGVNNYPHLYYLVLGGFARLAGVDAVAAWTILGLVLQSLLVIAIAIACVLVTRVPWTAFFGFTPLLVGTFSWLINGSWQTQMSSHAVLWGPFGVLFTLNAEAAALSVAGIALLVLVVAASRGVSRTRWLILGCVSAVAIGALANVQTYSFLAAAYLAAYGMAAWALTRRPRPVPIAATAILLLLVVFGGPLLAPTLGQLAMLVFGLVPALPGVIVLISRTRALVVIAGVIAVVAASPQIVGTALALVAHDPFLSYRVASTKDLGVTWYLGLICAIPALVALAFILTQGIRHGNRWWIAYPIGVLTPWLILSKNDIWGANQEPYRFWIDCYLLVIVTTLPVLAQVVLSRWRVAERSSTHTRAFRATAALTVVVIALSMVDWAGFYLGARATTLYSFTDARNTALSDASSTADEGLILPDVCIDRLALKAASGRQVAYYNLGMAWPARKDAIDAVYVLREDGTFPDPETFAAADIRWLLTDDTCESDWNDEVNRQSTSDLRRVASADYEDSHGRTVTITLWEVARP